jgi:isoleucyl-tRNA synthetase
MNSNAIANYWSDISLLDKCNEQTVSDSDPYLFFDGPPFMTGTPHYGHILAGYIKDTITRYHSSNGRYVPRVSGADTHGVPIEYEIDKLLGLKSYQDILNFGIKQYNNECRNIVLRCSSVWEEQSALLGRLIDYRNGYRTMSMDYMNSVWYIFKQLYTSNRVYSGYRVIGHSTACGTSLSNFELQQNYQDTNTESIYLLMQVDLHNVTEDVTEDATTNVTTYAIVWTTTPWTLPANYTLCVNPDIEYSIVSLNSNSINNYICYICCTSQLHNVFGKREYTTIKTLYGRELNGVTYTPPYRFSASHIKSDYHITTATFVNADTGTGIVHIAPAYGIDDYNHCTTIALHNSLFQYIDDNGFVMRLPEFIDAQHYIGLFYKELSKVIITELKSSGSLFDKRTINHSVPFCWRSDTEIIYKASSSWFVKVTDIRERMCELNDTINWLPKCVQSRFGNWLSNANDWNISRNRFWGTPIPIWRSTSVSVFVSSHLTNWKNFVTYLKIPLQTYIETQSIT